MNLNKGILIHTNVSKVISHGFAFSRNENDSILLN